MSDDAPAADDFAPQWSVPLMFARDRRLPYAVLVIVVLIAGTLLWANLRDDRPVAAVGKAIAAADPITVSKQWTVRVPDGQVDVGATRLLADVPNDLEARRYAAPDDGSFVGIRIVSKSASTGTAPQFDSAATSPTMSFALIAGGRTYPVKRASDVSGQAALPITSYLPMAARPSSLRLTVTFAGRSQSIDLRTGARQTGDFADLYADRGRFASCGTAQLPSGLRAEYEPAGCRFRAVRYGYVVGRKFAPKGSSWLVVDVTTTQPKGVVRARDGARFYVHNFSSESAPARLDGHKPLDVLRTAKSSAGASYRLLFEVSTDRSAKHVFTTSQQTEILLRTGRGDDGTDPVIHESWTVPIS